MADEEVQTGTPPAEAAPPTEGSGISVEVEPENRRRIVNDDELTKLTAGGDDEIERANNQAKQMVKGLRTAYQEQRRRAEQWSRDAATASTLAEQLYRENQQLRQNVNRSETALIAQAVTRAESQLDHAKTKARQAQASGDPDLIVAAQEELAQAVSEVGRLKLLNTTVPSQEAAESSGGSPPPQQERPAPPRVSSRTQSWIADHPWFGDQPHHDKEMTTFALRQHQHLLLDGITEENNPELYWRTIEERLAQQYPEKFKKSESPEGRPPEGRTRPVAVTGGTRSATNGNGAITTQADGKRVVRLTESQVRLASRIGLTPEQYAAQLVKEQQEEERLRRPS